MKLSCPIPPISAPSSTRRDASWSNQLRRNFKMNAHLQPTGSAYFLTKETQEIEKHTLSVLVDNEPGILARVVGLFSARGYNIDSLTVSETEHNRRLSRITVVVVATPKTLVQIKLQLE